MNFVWKMAWRDSRASRRRLVLFSFSVVLGIAALVAIGSFSANLSRTVQTQAKGLLGADLIVGSHAAPDGAVRRYLRSLGGEAAHETGFSSMMVFPTAHGDTRLVQVRAIEGGFPFYGDFTTDPAGAAAAFRAATAAGAPVRPVVLLEDTLLRQFNARVGDPVKLGNETFTIIGALRKLPGDSSAFANAFAPRALIPRAALAATGLLGKPTLVRYRTMLKLPAGTDPEAVVRELRARFPNARLSFDTVAHRQRELGHALQHVQGFLSLVGFIALFLGAIGVASAVGVYVRQKITTVAVLRCLGATGRQSFAVYLVQGVALGLLGATLGALLGIAVQLALPRLLAGLLPFPVEFFVAWGAVARGAGAGLVICVLFALLPLLAVRRVPPLAALRSAFAERAETGRDGARLGIAAFIVVAVAGFSVWQTNSLRLGLGFAAGLAVGGGVLAGLARLVAVTARAVSSGRRVGWRRLPFVVRQGIANLHRPQNRTVLLLFALGLGTFLMLTLYLTRATLLREIEVTGDQGRPNLVFFDIQDDQIGPLTRLVARAGAPVRISAPIVTMRITSINGRTVDQLLGPAGAGHTRRDGNGIPSWTLRREYRSTYRSRLTDTEHIVAGRFVGRVNPDTAEVPISVEQGLMQEMHLKLGDEIDWDVQGVPLRSRIASVRTVEWRRFEPNFFIVFPRGVLEPAPKFYVAAVRADTPALSARVQRAVVAAFPNVSAIDLTLIMQTVDGIFAKIGFVIRFLALFTVGTGVVVLVGAVLTGRFQRIRETVLLRTLGATRRQLTAIMAVEYAVLGALAAITGALLAVAAEALLAHFVFKTPAVFPVPDLALAVVAATGLTLVTGLVANRGVTRHPPLAVLRQET